MFKIDPPPAKLACLEFALKMCLQTGDNRAVVLEAEKYWTWLNTGNGEAGDRTPPPQVPKLNDDIPF